MQSTQPSLFSQSAQYISELFMTNPEAMVITRPNGQILAVNAAFCQLFGLTEAEVFGADKFLFTDPQDTRLIKLMAKCQKYGQAQGTITFVRADGAKFDGEAFTTLIHDSSGQAQVSGRIRTENIYWPEDRTTKELESQLGTLFHAIPFPVVLVNLPDGTICDVNEACQRLFGYTRQETLGKTSVELGLIDPEGRLDRLSLLAQNNRIDDTEITAYTRQGKALRLLLHVNTLRHQDKRYGLVYLINLTERAQLEATLRASEQKYHLLFSHMLNGFVLYEALWDGQGYPYDFRILEINPAAERLLGFTGNDKKGKTMREVLPHVGEAEFARFAQVVLTGDPLSYEKFNIASKKHLEISVFRPEPGQVAFSFHDITPLKEKEGEIERINVELRRSNTSLEQFAYAASHDLLEPLRQITLSAQMLMRHLQGQLVAEDEQYLHFVHEGAQRIIQMVKGLLAYSRTGRRHNLVGPVACEKAYEQALANLVIQKHESGANIVCEPLPLVQGDLDLLTQVFQNLLSNAFKYRHPVRPLQITIRASQPAPDMWEIQVQDNGIGIAPEYFERIFLIFQRLHTREEYEGVGIGLALCKRIIEQLGGEIWVTSEVSQGTTFSFTLPTTEIS